MMIKDILSYQGDLKEIKDYNMVQRPAIHNAIGEYIEEYKYRCMDNYMECIKGIKPWIGFFNIYGRIVHKNAKGYSHF